MLEAATAALALYLFLTHMFTADKPFIEPGLFADRNFVAGILLMFTVGVLLLATMALLPPFLQSLLGFPVITAGYVLAPRGAGTMLAMMVVGRLVGKVDTRVLVLTGLALMGWSLHAMTQWNTDVGVAESLYGRRAGNRARLHLRAALDDRVRDAGAALPQRRHGDVQPDPQLGQQRRHLARHDRARPRGAAEPRGAQREHHPVPRRAAGARRSAALEPVHGARPRRARRRSVAAGAHDRLLERLSLHDVSVVLAVPLLLLLRSPRATATREPTLAAALAGASREYDDPDSWRLPRAHSGERS